jgi:hypothetical protein
MLGLIIYISIKGKYVDQKAAEYSYLNKAKIDYQVFLKPNNLYPPNQKNLGEGNYYIKKLTDYIEANLKYEFIGDRPAELQGKYSVKAIMDGKVGDEKSKKVIWKHEEQLSGEQAFKVNSDKHIIELKTNIIPKHFEDIANEKAKESGLNFETNLVVYWDIQIEAKTDKGIAHEQLNPTMEIPINTNNYFEIKGNLTPQKKGAIERVIKAISPSYRKNMIVCSILVIISLIIILFILVYTNNKPKEDPIQLKLKKIFKNHGDRLVRLDNENLRVEAKLIHVKEFEDLVRIADEVGKPILYNYEEGINEISTFYVFDDKYVYILQLSIDAQIEASLSFEYQKTSDAKISV